MASMQHDFIHPRQLEDVKAIRAAIKSFTAHMKHMMLLMKDLGTTLEQVSHAFDALTSLSFSDDGVKHYVHHFSEEVLHMMEGTAFQNYNKLVHEEVLVPVEQLRTSLKATEKSASAEKSSFNRYKKAKRKVDTQEKSYAARSKSLDTSKSYPTNVQTRDTSLQKLQTSKNDFEEKFVGLVKEVEKVTATTLKRYLDLNAGYMASVIDALTSTDPTVEEAVALYREAQWQQRQSAIQQRCAEVDTEVPASYVSQGYRLGPTTSKREEEERGASRGPQTTPAAGRQAPANDSLTSNLSNREKGRPASPASPKGPPAAVASAVGGKPPVAQRGAFTVTTTAANHVSSPPAAAAAAAASGPPPPNITSSEAGHAIDDVEDEDFGSVSQVGTAGRVPPPLYNFSRGPLSQVSSVRPQSGYVAHADANLTNDFLRKMQSGGLTASEVSAARVPKM